MNLILAQPRPRLVESTMSRWQNGFRLIMRASGAALLTLILTASPAFAVFPGNGGGGTGGPGGGGTGAGGGGGGGGGGGPPTPTGTVPEIGLGAAASALTLLAGATLIALDRRRRALKAEPQAV